MREHGADHVRPLVLFLLYGYPAAFRAGRERALFFVIGVELAAFVEWHHQPELAASERHAGTPLGVMSNETLLAIPFFTFMGIVLEKSAWPRTFWTRSASFSARSVAVCLCMVVIVGALLAATTGVVAGLGDRDGPDFAADHAALWL